MLVQANEENRERQLVTRTGRNSDNDQPPMHFFEFQDMLRVHVDLAHS